MTQKRRIYRVSDASVEMNRILGDISDRMDELEGYSGQGTFRTVPVSDEQATEYNEVVRYDQITGALAPSELTLSDTVWDDLRFPVATLKLGGSKPPSWEAFPSGSNLLALHFGDEAVNEEEVFFTAQLPHGFKYGTPIDTHIHWSPASTGIGTVRWGFEYTWQDINGVFASPVIIYKNVTLTEPCLDKHIYTEIGTLTDPGIVDVSSMIICRLFRNSSHAEDTFTAAAAVLLEADFHVQRDALGSREEFVK